MKEGLHIQCLATQYTPELEYPIDYVDSQSVVNFDLYPWMRQGCPDYFFMNHWLDA